MLIIHRIQLYLWALRLFEYFFQCSSGLLLISVTCRCFFFSHSMMAEGISKHVVYPLELKIYSKLDNSDFRYQY